MLASFKYASFEKHERFHNQVRNFRIHATATTKLGSATEAMKRAHTTTIILSKPLDFQRLETRKLHRPFVRRCFRWTWALVSRTWSMERKLAAKQLQITWAATRSLPPLCRLGPEQARSRRRRVYHFSESGAMSFKPLSSKIWVRC